MIYYHIFNLYRFSFSPSSVFFCSRISLRKLLHLVCPPGGGEGKVIAAPNSEPSGADLARRRWKWAASPRAVREMPRNQRWQWKGVERSLFLGETGNIGTFWRIMCNRVTFIAMFDYRMANLERVQARVLLLSRRSRDYIVYNITLSISVC